MYHGKLSVIYYESSQSRFKTFQTIIRIFDDLLLVAAQEQYTYRMLYIISFYTHKIKEFSSHLFDHQESAKKKV